MFSCPKTLSFRSSVLAVLVVVEETVSVVFAAVIVNVLIILSQVVTEDKEEEEGMVIRDDLVEEEETIPAVLEVEEVLEVPVALAAMVGTVALEDTEQSKLDQNHDHQLSNNTI